MKVFSVNNLMFRASNPVKKPENNNITNQTGVEINNITPDFGVKVPQNYTKLGETNIGNGLTLHSYKLANGYTISIIPMKDSPAVVQNYVNVGSMNETDDIKGISHFLEHMAFNGTKGGSGYLKLNNGDSFKLIDSMGGWTNASTNYGITDYVNSTPLLSESDIEKQIKIIASMTEDLALSEDMITKEKAPVCSEINMILDVPQTVALDQTIRTLFNIKSSADELVGGSTAHIQALNRQKIKNYYDTYYTPDNMNLVITGDVNPDKVIEIAAKAFKSKKAPVNKKFEQPLFPINTAVRKDFINNKTLSTSIVAGFAGAGSDNLKSSILFEIANRYLLASSGKFNHYMENLNTVAYADCEKLIANPKAPQFYYFSFECTDENSEKVLKAFYDTLSNVKAPDSAALNNIKKAMLEDYYNQFDYSSQVNMLTGNCILNSNIDYLTKFEAVLNEITPQEVEDFIKKYLNPQKAAITVVHPVTDKETVINNYKSANSISFKSHGRKPLNQENLTEKTLENNIKAGFIKTKNDRIHFKLTCSADKMSDISNNAVKTVLDAIYSEGTLLSTREDLSKFEDDNLLSLLGSLDRENLVIAGNVKPENFRLFIAKAKELLYYPRINEKTLEKVKERLKDSLARTEDSAYSLYSEHESKNNPFYVSKKELEKTIDSVTVEDVKKLHNYIINNSSMVVSSNLPEKMPEFEDVITDELRTFPTVKPYKCQIPNYYSENTAPVVLTKEKPVSQADIMQVYKFPSENSIKESAAISVMNQILSSSDSIGLFNSLREKEHLAYSVYSDTKLMGDCGELSLNILTTTDNSETGEKSYENIERSIKGFHRQIDCLLNSQYTYEDFESAKKIIKAQLLNNEGTESKVYSINKGLNKDFGADYYNKLFKELDNITRADIDKLAQKVFKNPPVYSIAASKDSLENNEEFLAGLKQGIYS